MNSAAASAKICAVIRAIPVGETRSYAAVAREAGLPGRARLVVWVLKSSDGLPWHRVLRADGKIGFPADSEAFQQQQARLQREGVAIQNGRVKPGKAISLDAHLWA